MSGVGPSPFAGILPWASPVRAVDTVYQAGPKTRLIVITGFSGATPQFQVGAANPPTTVLGKASNLAADILSYAIPPTQYYRLVGNGQNFTTWQEADYA